MKGIAVAIVVVVLVAFGCYKVDTAGAVYSCGNVSGGAQWTDDGVKLMEGFGDWVHDLAEKRGKDRRAELERVVHDVFHKVIMIWLKSLIHSGRGWKVDPEVLKLKERAAKERADAESQCTPCPTADQDQNPDGPTTDPDPRAVIPAVASTLKGASLAADALRRAGFPADQIPMGVAVAKLESGFDPNAINPTLITVRGMFQIYYGAHPELTMLHWADPYKNARDAWSIYKAAGNSWDPWSTAASARQQVEKVAPNQGTARVELPDDGTRRQGQGCTPVVGNQDDQAGTGSFVSADFSIYTNPRTVAQAIDYMDRMVRNRTPLDRTGRCLHYVGVAYGYQGTHSQDGSYFAIEHWQITPAKYKHPGADGAKAPRGSLLYWNTGAGRAGHIAIAAGNGMVYSTDAPTRGLIGLVPFSYFKGYGEFVGFADPYFPGQTTIKKSSYAVAA